MQRSVSPTPFSLNASIEYLLMAVIGGLATLPGAILGAALVTVVNDRLQDLLPRLFGAQGNYEIVVFGILLVLVLQLAPTGLYPLLRRLFPSARPKPIPPASPLPHRTPAPPGTPLLAATNLQKRFGGLLAVDGVSLAVAAGEILGLIGPNGAGKSTTFNLLTGVAPPTAGTVSFRAHPITGLPPPAIARLGIARSFQHVRLVPGMSTLENVALGAHLRGTAGPLRALFRLDRAEESRLLAEAHHQLARVDLADAALLPADTLALGQQRIVELARALAADPALLLLDEPAAGLRTPEKQALATLLRTLRAEGLAILLVEHDMAFTMPLTDRLLVLQFGHPLAEGTPATIQANPAVIEAYLGAPA